MSFVDGTQSTFVFATRTFATPNWFWSYTGFRVGVRPLAKHTRFASGF